MTDTRDPKVIAAAFWDCLYERDFEGLKAFFASDARYTDIGSPADDIALGPDQIVARLRLGVEPIDSYTHEVSLVVADGNAVVTEHTETWGWRTGESVALPFVSVQEFTEGKISRWFDYWDLQTLLGVAPSWWIEHIMVGWQ
ncbi:MAG: nuclear transport factor 2 family protein [Actinobacteria bacterium]|nr:nuclear transport factor 2 family protein [Actinomycetota bacterium]